jgi:hypothetical protein
MGGAHTGGENAGRAPRHEMIAALTLMVSLLGAATAPADVTRDVVLAVDRCPALPREELARLLTLELDMGVVSAEGARVNPIRVGVSCTGSLVVIDLEDQSRKKHLRRTSSFPPRREDVTARLIALAISELVVADSDAAPADSTIVVVSSEAPAPSPAPVIASPRASPTLPAVYLLAVGQVLGPFSGVGTSAGGGLRYGWSATRALRTAPAFRIGPALDVEIGFAGATVPSQLGQVDVSIWSTTLRGSLRIQRGRFWMDGGAGARFGLARLSGRPSDPKATDGAVLASGWGGPVGYVGVGGRLGHVVATLGFEAGHVFERVSGEVDAGSPIAVAGNWACGTLGVGWGS